MSEINNLFWFTQKKLESNETEEFETFLHLKYSSEAQFDDFQIITDSKELKQIASIFPKEIEISENEVEFIVKVII